MTRYLLICIVSLIGTLFSAGETACAQSSRAQEPDSGRIDEQAIAVNEAPVNIGGRFGVIIGGGRGLRIGGPNGVQFGGGRGAIFGGRNGVRIGGGQGLSIGPEAVPDDRQADMSVPTETPDTPEALGEDAIIIYHAMEAPESLHLKIGTQELELQPGRHIQMHGQDRIPLQIVGEDERVIMRRTLSPGSYVSRKGLRGWIISRGELPADWRQPPLEETPHAASPSVGTLRPVERQPVAVSPRLGASAPPASDPVGELDELDLVPPTVEIPNSPAPSQLDNGLGDHFFR